MDEKLTKDEKKALRQEEWKTKAQEEQKRKFWKAVALWSFGGILLVLAIWALVIFSSGTTTQSSTTIAMPKVTAKDFQTHPTGAKATLTEYADFECPACKAYYPVVKQLQQDFGSKLNVVYRFFPLKTIHPNAVNSAKAGYAAALQGKFWEMHDKLFDTQDSWAPLSNPEPTFLGYAKALGLNVPLFQKDYEAATTESFVNDMYNGDVAMGLNATPTFFLNGKEITNPQSYQDFKTLIQNALK